MPEQFAISWAERLQALKPSWQVGGIFPSEMLSFLIACEREAVDCVVESGRERGYSTTVLAEYAAWKGIPVISIDRPVTPEVGRDTRERLAGKPVRLIDGDTLELLGDVVPSDVRRIALLVDGPKEEGARRLILAGIHCFPVVVVAYHGCYLDSPVGRAMKHHFPDLYLTSDDDVRSLDGLQGFATWERRVVTELYSGPRDPAESTLGIARVHSRVGMLDLLLFDGSRRVLAPLAYLVRRLLHQPGVIPPPFMLALRWKRRRRYVRSA